MYSMITLKARGRVFSPMSQELEGKNARQTVSEEHVAELKAKASVYAMLNRPSPPF